MRKLLFSMVIIFLILSISYSYGIGEKDEKSSVRSDLSISEASTLLKNIAPNLKVTAVRMSPVEGLWEVDIEAGNRKGLLYIDSSKKYLIQGTVIEIEGKKNLTQDRLSELNKVDVSQIPLDDAIVMGDENAKHRVIVFDDPE